MRKLLSIFWPKAKPIQVVRRDVSRLTIDEWRSSEDLTRRASKVLDDPTVRHMIDVLRNSHLAGWVMPSYATIDERAVAAAKCEGYGIALNNLESLAKHQKAEKAIEATFAPENMDALENEL